MSIFSENEQPTEDTSASEGNTNPGVPTVEQINPGDGEPGSLDKPHRERPEVRVVVRDKVTGETTILPSNPPSSVVMTTLQANRDARVADANAAVEQYAALYVAGPKATDAQGREAIRRMLLVRESFEVNGAFDWDTFIPYADNVLGRLRVPPKNSWQRLARVCCPKTTKPPQVSKFGYILATLDRLGVKSANVMAEFAKCEPVKEGGPNYTGMDRFVRLFKRDMKEQAAEDEIEVEADPKNPYERYADEQLVKSAKFLTEELRMRKMLRGDIVDVEDVLNDEAVEKLR
jgi:hypothetical protein